MVDRTRPRSPSIPAAEPAPPSTPTEENVEPELQGVLSADSNRHPETIKKATRMKLGGVVVRVLPIRTTRMSGIKMRRVRVLQKLRSARKMPQRLVILGGSSTRHLRTFEVIVTTPGESLGTPAEMAELDGVLDELRKANDRAERSLDRAIEALQRTGHL